MTALENTLETMNWKFLLLVIFLMPHGQCNAFARSKTRVLFDQLDEILVGLAIKHDLMYTENHECINSLDVLKDDYRSEQYGIALLNNILQRYHNLTQLVNFGCKKQMNGKISISEEENTCEPFGCHLIEIELPNSSKISLRTETNTDTNNNANTNANTNTNNNKNTNSNSNTNVNANHININVNFIQAFKSRKPSKPSKPSKPKKPKTTKTTKTPPAKDDQSIPAPVNGSELEPKET